MNLLLDPGMAFGTGTHPTTAMCLRWLDTYPPVGLRVIDYGTGSGILAIAAARLGAAQVHATDIDPQALIAAEQNAARNQARLDCRLVKDFEAAPPPAADVVLANILAGPLMELAPTLASHLKPGGHLVLSGLLENQANELIQAYHTQGIRLALTDSEEGWALLSGAKDG